MVDVDEGQGQPQQSALPGSSPALPRPGQAGQGGEVEHFQPQAQGVMGGIDGNEQGGPLRPGKVGEVAGGDGPTGGERPQQPAQAAAQGQEQPGHALGGNPAGKDTAYPDKKRAHGKDEGGHAQHIEPEEVVVAEAAQDLAGQDVGGQHQLRLPDIGREVEVEQPLAGRSLAHGRDVGGEVVVVGQDTAEDLAFGGGQPG